jgi:SRSO17 transposase
MARSKAVYMTKPRAAKPTVHFIDSYSELYKDLFPEVRAYEYFKYLLLGLIRAGNIPDWNEY